MRRLVRFKLAAALIPIVLVGCAGGEDAPTPFSPEAKHESAPVSPQSSPPTAEQKQLEGTWEVVSQVYGGTPQFQPRGGTQLIIRGATYARKALGESYEMGAIRADSTKKPGALEFVPEVGREKGRIIQCVYELDGDHLRYCYRPSGGFRPTEFNAEPGSELEVVTLRRAKAK